ncbi:alpha/beta hydrolase-fold protein [Flavobacterium sp. 3HN19-14]|uniref:alpha/beta hydrolase-fold protein n=1 Tax=Flavobacterium sp. 3HN19-14 TaxID=3448133 RepID=UPI003EE2C512
MQIFLAETLKPYIDLNYRTKPEASMNALIGSSMGALIATYGACEHPEAFRKVGSMSPAYWFALSSMESYLSNVAALENHRMYFVAGTNEDSDMVPDINSVRDDLLADGLAASNAHTKFDTYGTHTESYWRGEFGALYQWLFAEENLSVENPIVITPKIMQSVSGKLFVEGIPTATQFQIVDMLGQTVQKIQLSDGFSELPDGLAKGSYLLINTSVKPVRVIKK